MTDFITRHTEVIECVLEGFDRLMFRGVLRSINYSHGLDRFLTAHGILLKDFGSFAEQCTRALDARAKEVATKSNRPYIYLQSSGVRKDEYARQIAERDGVTAGLICVLACVEPCVTADLRRNRDSGHLEVTYRMRKCRFFYFYWLDWEFGLMHLRIQSWVPFDVQVYVNGRLYLAEQLKRESISFEQIHNALFDIGDLPRAQAILRRLETRNWARFLNPPARRVNPLLKELGFVGRFGYYWTVYESEYATDVLFKSRKALQKVYPSLWGHALRHFSSRDVLRFLTDRVRGMLPNRVVTSKRHRVEGVRLKHQVNENSLKMYDKEGIILRIETTINNPRRFQALRRKDGRLVWGKMSKGLRDLARRITICRDANGRYLEALAVVGDPTPSHQLLDAVSRRVRKGRKPYRPLRPIAPEESRLFEAILHGEHLLHGFTSRHIQRLLFPTQANTPKEAARRRGQVARHLRLLRAHQLIRKVPHRNLYRIAPHGHLLMATALIFRQTDWALLKDTAA